MIFDKTKYKFLKFKKLHDSSFINYCKQKFFLKTNNKLKKIKKSYDNSFINYYKQGVF